MIAEAVTTIGLAGLLYFLIRRFLPGPPGEKLSTPESPGKRIAPATALDKLFVEAEGYLRVGLYNEAELKLLEIERLNPHYPKLYNRMGIVYLELGEYQKAVESFEHAVLEDPAKASRHANLGMAYLQVKKYSLAKKAIERALEIEPNNEKYKRLLNDVRNR